MHVVMLVNNPCTNDSRVIKSAEALADTGQKVTVVCRQFGDLPEREERNGVRYHRIEPVPLDWTRLKMRIRTVISVRPHRNVAPIRHDGPTEDSRAARPSGAEADGIQATVRNDDTAASNREPADTVPMPQAEYFKHTCRAGRKLPEPVEQPTKKSLPVAKWIFGSAKRAAKRILTAAYWFSEADEFGTAARRHIAELAPDVVHAHDLTTLPAGGRAAAHAGAWLVYDSHELEMHRNSSYPWFVQLRRRRLERKYIRRADAVVTVSESIADHLRTDYGIPRPTVVMNAPLFDANVTPATTVRQDLALGEDVSLCVYVGNVTVNRGLEHVVRALALLPDLHFATVGPRRPATEAELLELATELGVQDRLHLIDPVAPTEVVGYIATADASVLPIQNVCLSYYYCMPNKLLESVFAGVPVAVANLLEMRRFVEASGCGVIMDETDPKVIAKAIEQVITGRDQYVLSPDRRELIAEEYGWPAQANHLQSVYAVFSAMIDQKATSYRS